MGAKRGGGPRKGQTGKKAQIEKMIETAKKANNSPNSKPMTAKPGSKVFADNTNVHGATIIQNPHTGLKLSADNAGPVKCSSGKLAIVRLPCQGSVSFPKKLPLNYTQPKPITATLPQGFKNPNRVVVRLPVTQTSKEPTTFLSLPSEIRNIIYDYAMPRRKYGIKSIPRESKFEKRPTELTYFLPLSVTVSGPGLTAQQGERRRLFDLPKRLYMDKAIPPFSLSPSQASLLLVSKKVSEETTPMFYGRNMFFFQSMRPLRKFLSTLRPETRSMLRSLQLIHHTAGNPSQMANQTWKDLHDRCWHDLCFQIRDQCTGLHSLALDLTVNDLPFQMGPLASWMSPLYAFMNLGHLKKFHLRLHQIMTEDTILEVQAYEVRKELMGPNFYEPATPMNDIFAEKPKLKVRPTVNSLRITGHMHNQRAHNQSVPTQSAYDQTMDRLMQLPVHMLPRRLPLLNDPRATVFWHPPSPTDDHPLFHRAGSRGEAEALRKMRLQKQEKSKGKGKAKA
ncbi:MAG: hypothetical protein LQ343_007174 [Gyalolechia ehrenbergii]|nr:MAG: hypothetical protein LQ343_007174 [Gyalolechia ehrenbergii]